MGTGTGLLDASVLDRITVSTYDANNNLLKSASGRAVLGTNQLSVNTQEISFSTTQPFTRVGIGVASGAALSTDVAVYYAFADNRPSGLPTIIAPLPVELTVFAGKWAGGSAELDWATASEKNSACFVVERSTGADVAFRAVEQVAAAGSSSRPRAYALRDAEASAQGVAILYYRLRQVDLDGRQAFSPVVAVAVGKAATARPTLALHPNRTLDAQAVTISLPELAHGRGCHGAGVFANGPTGGAAARGRCRPCAGAAGVGPRPLPRGAARRRRSAVGCPAPAGRRALRILALRSLRTTAPLGPAEGLFAGQCAIGNCLVALRQR